MSKKFITEKQRNLIINSESAKVSFVGLYDFLLENSEVTFEDIANFSQLNNLQSYYDELLNDCRSEWEVFITQPTNNLGENYSEKKVVCDLCGHKYLKIENKIQNKLNKSKLVVGSECVKEFGDTVQGMIKSAQRDVQRATKRLTIENTIPGIRKFVELSSSYINKVEIVVSERLEDRWRTVFNQIGKEYELFINSKSEDISGLLTSWNEKNLLVKDIERFVEKHKGKKFIANKKVQDWLLSNGKQEEIRMIRKNSGIIDWSVSHRIYEPNLMKFLLGELQKHFVILNIEILNVDVSKLTVNLVFKGNQKTINASIKYKELMLNYGGFIFDGNLDESFEDIYKNSDINEIKSQEKILELLNEKSLYNLIKIYRSENEILYKEENRYFLLNFSNLIKDLKKYYFRNDIINVEVGDAFQSNVIRVMTEKDYTNFKQMKELSSELKIR